MFVEEYQKFLGVKSPSKSYVVAADEIRRFAEAIGSNNPLHYDSDYARFKGYPDIIAPATFCLLLKSPEIPGLWMPSSGMIHAGQDFHYNRPIHAGETITVCQRVCDVFEKQGKSGLNVFLSTEKLMYDESETLVCSFKVTLVIKDRLFALRDKAPNQTEKAEEKPAAKLVEEFTVGQQLGPVTLPPLSRRDIARYAGASGDYNAIHVDDEAAKKIGFPGAIAHGMLSAALQSCVAEEWAGERYEWSGYTLSFKNPVLPGNELSFTAVVTATEPLSMDFLITNQNGGEVSHGNIKMKKR